MLALGVSAFLLMSLIFYAVTGGADFGGGVWDFLAIGPRANEQRKALARAIGPIWEADHVWLVLAVVILFTGFPPAFAVMMTALNIPITLMLIGIVLRGSAFIFRKYDSQSDEVEQRWSKLFGAASFFTPFAEGVILGALSAEQIRVVNGEVTTGFFAGWTTLFAFACGLFALGLCAFLAATYMTIETKEQRDLQNDFRRRALWSGLALVPMAALILVASRKGSLEIFRGPAETWAGLAAGLAALFAIAALVSLWRWKFALARILAIGQATLILVAWGLAQYPNLITPDVTIFNSSAPAATLRLLIIALGAGTVLLLPALAFLFYIFKGKESS
jgi:cytochrome d ubiquinol oxidase subunit II